MRNLFKILPLMCCFFASTLAQNVLNSVPVKWERYKVEEKNVSALFPKLPVLLADYSKSCFGEETAQYIAYANEAVFNLRVTSKVKPDGYCPRREKFSEKNFAERLKEIRDSEGEKAEVPAGDKATAKFVGKFWVWVLFNDFKNNRWFELQVIARDINKPSVNNFLESIKIGQQTEGIEIADGAAKNYGDAMTQFVQKEAAKTNPEQNEAAKTNSNSISGQGNGSGDEAGSGSSTQGKTQQDALNDPVVIVFKPRAGYTDSARQNNIQGAVRLRVTFLANGGIGSITPIKVLSHGLTEQSIMAARKIFFLPPRKNKVQYSVTKVVEYRFALY